MTPPGGGGLGRRTELKAFSAWPPCVTLFPALMPSISKNLYISGLVDERRRSKIVAPLPLVTLAAHTISSGMLHQLSGPQRGPLRVVKPVESAFARPDPGPAVWLAPIVSESYLFCGDEGATTVSVRCRSQGFPFYGPRSFFASSTGTSPCSKNSARGS